YPATAIPLPGYAARLAQGSPRPRDLVLQALQSGLAAGCFRVSHYPRSSPLPFTVRDGLPKAEIPGSGPLRLTPPTNF
ncbi:MAG: hypothetical protein MK104_15800, partial [Erythrobacter sp.]|nr:hypothetical protein [Erythrobacter sp.]